MNDILVDSSVWISFLKGEARSRQLADLLALNRIRTNELILAELMPSLHQRKEKHLVSLFREIKINALRIDWHDIIDIQTLNLKHGINNVGIPDLIIAQNSLQYGTPILTYDRHFALMASIHKIRLVTL